MLKMWSSVCVCCRGWQCPSLWVRADLSSREDVEMDRYDAYTLLMIPKEPINLCWDFELLQSLQILILGASSFDKFSTSQY